MPIRFADLSATLASGENSTRASGSELEAVSDHGAPAYESVQLEDDCYRAHGSATAHGSMDGRTRVRGCIAASARNARTG